MCFHRELEDFLSFMDHQASGGYAEELPQLPDVAIGFPGLQLQPHADSPCAPNSNGCESMGVEPPSAVVHLPFAGSAGSHSRAVDMSDTPSEVCAFMPCDNTESKAEPQLGAMHLEELQGTSGATAGLFLTAPAADSKRALGAATVGPHADLLWSSGQSTAPLHNPGCSDLPLSAASGISPSGAAVTGTADVQGHQTAPCCVASHLTLAHQQSQQQQQQQATQLLLSDALAQHTGSQSLPAVGSSRTAEAPAVRNSNGSRAVHRVHSHEGSSSGGNRFQISHSSVEKQRRDRLNSLIDELSDIVPPADPKYGTDSSSVRRPKHVVLADTINLLKSMQAKLQLEEAEIITLKQQAAAVVAMAASQQHQQPMIEYAPGDGSGAIPVQASRDMPVLSAAPGGCATTCVLVEQGANCLFVKVNCKDRKGLLADVVSALKAFPIVISTAAITTTKDGTVHDVFEVRVGSDKQQSWVTLHQLGS